MSDTLNEGGRFVPGRDTGAYPTSPESRRLSDEAARFTLERAMSETRNEEGGIAPALTPEEWVRPVDALPNLYLDRYKGGATIDGYVDTPREASALAGFLLQIAGPDGGPLFTREDVDVILYLAAHYATEWDDEDVDVRRGRSLAARLARLLPPEEP